jgi:4'-phosphopantetheinyl transferase
MSAAEIADLDRLRTPKRRADRLLGRWTGKRLLQYVVHREEGRLIPLPELEIWNSESGAPALHCSRLDDHRYSFSLSHSHDYAFCAALAGNAGSVGADIEAIAARSEIFVQDYFTDDERARVAMAPAAFQPTLATAIWSAKEAALKALGLGLRMDTRKIDCGIETVESETQSWSHFPIRLTDGCTLTGWWRVHAGFVLTLALAVEEAVPCN